MNLEHNNEVYKIDGVSIKELWDEISEQLLEIDLTNTTVSGTVDTVAAGGSSAGTGYTTTQNTY